MEPQVLSVVGNDSDNRSELETWMDEHRNLDYDFEFIKNIDSSQLKWASEERKRINYAHNIVIPEIQKIINSDIHWKKKYRTELPCVNYLGLLPSEMEELDRYHLEGHYGDLLKCYREERRRRGGYGDDGRFSKHGGQADGHYLIKYSSFAYSNGTCIRNIAHLWGSNIINRNNIRLAERIEDCKNDIKTVNSKLHTVLSKISTIDDNKSQLVSKYDLEHVKSVWDSQLKAQNNLFVTQLIFNNRIGSFESDILGKISDAEDLCLNSTNSIESNLTYKINRIKSSLHEIQEQYKKLSLSTNDNEIKLYSKLSDNQLENNIIIDELELKLQNITESFSRKLENYQQKIDVLTKRQNFMYFIIVIVCVYYICTNIYYLFNSTNTQNMLLLN
tara:strand:- start:1254 stop:2420 length:1167 start_codon:yes stop_codon:yes gene_type:complete